MTKWILLIFGLLLLVSGTCAWDWLSLRPYPGDADLAFEPLARVPISQINGQKSLKLSFTAPKSAAWERIRRSWGNPEFVIAAVTKAPELQYCFDAISVTRVDGPELNTLPLSDTIYGYGTFYRPSCQSGGRRLSLEPCQTAKVTLIISDNTVPSSAEIIVAPVWPFTKDKLVGVGLDEDLRIIAKLAFAFGCAACLLALICFRAVRKPKVSVGGFK